MRRTVSVILALLTCVATAGAVDININLATTYQTIEGLGAHNHITAWTVKQGPFYITVPLAGQYDTMAHDLGLSMVRGWEVEGFNPSAGVYTVPAELATKFTHAVELHRRGVDRFIISVLSAPAWMKGNNSYANGGHLLASHYNDFAQFLVRYVDTMQTRTGFKPYAISLQNELAFSEPYGSCEYTTSEFRDAMKVVGPALVAAGHGEVKIFGSEHLLWGLGSYEDAVYNDAAAAPYLDVVATHQYSHGIQPTPSSASATEWTSAHNYASSKSRPLWMTETSGYPETWAGALDLAAYMYAALQYGRITGWCWLSISQEDGNSRLMQPSGYTPLGVASKHYFRFVRPGAVMVRCDDPGDGWVFATAYKHVADNTVTVVILNTGTSAKFATLIGSGLPAQFDVYQSTSTQVCARIGTASVTVALPAQSITTLYNGTIPQYPYTTAASPQSGRSPGLAHSAAARQPGSLTLVSLDGRVVARAGASPAPGVYFAMRRPGEPARPTAIAGR